MNSYNNILLYFLYGGFVFVLMRNANCGKKHFYKILILFLSKLIKTPSVSYADSSLKEGAIKAFLFEEGGTP